MSKVNSLRVTVVSVGETEKLGAKEFCKRLLIGKAQDGDYTNEYAFEFVQDKVDLLDGILPNTDVTVSFNIRCRKYEAPGKPVAWFTSLSGWKIEI